MAIESYRKFWIAKTMDFLSVAWNIEAFGATQINCPQRKPTLAEYKELWIARLLEFLPISLVSDIGAYLGENAAWRAIQDNQYQVKNLHLNIERLQGINDSELRKHRIIEWAIQRGRMHAEFTILHKLVHEGYLEIVGQENLKNISKPAIFVSCHLANWELVGHIMASLSNPFCALYAPLKNPIYQKIAVKSRRKWRTDIELVPASTRAMFQLTRALKAGSNLLLFIDEEKGGYVWGPSLGRKLPYAGNRWLAARLAVQHKVDIVPLYIEQVDNARYRAVVEPKLQIIDSDRHSCAKYLADQMDHHLNQWIKKRLEQWYWLAHLDLDKPCPF
ncbi:MAG: lysophospholipid acyltransferase family protein [Snowella sp.]|nr:lysophospholipid acyltransferase family protein [Snowella sp.]